MFVAMVFNSIMVARAAATLMWWRVDGSGNDDADDVRATMAILRAYIYIYITIYTITHILRRGTRAPRWFWKCNGILVLRKVLTNGTGASWPRILARHIVVVLSELERFPALCGLRDMMI